MPLKNRSAILIYLSGIFLCSLASLQAQPDWKLKKDNIGIRIYTGNSGMISVRSETAIPSDLSCMSQTMKNVPDYTKWVYKCEKAEIVKKIEPEEFIYYQVNNAPWPVRSRDMVVHLKILRDQNQVIVSSESIDGIIPEKSGIVRIKKFNSSWTFILDKDSLIQVTNILSLDPGGNIPDKIARKFVIDGPFNTLLNFKKITSGGSCSK